MRCKPPTRSVEGEERAGGLALSAGPAVPRLLASCRSGEARGDQAATPLAASAPQAARRKAQRGAADKAPQRSRQGTAAGGAHGAARDGGGRRGRNGGAARMRWSAEHGRVPGKLPTGPELSGTRLPLGARYSLGPIRL
jgi:hypothetical protein